LAKGINLLSLWFNPKLETKPSWVLPLRTFGPKLRKGFKCPLNKAPKLGKLESLIIQSNLSPKKGAFLKIPENLPSQKFPLGRSFLPI